MPDKVYHIVCFSGGHSSALVAIEVVRKYGKENVILLNHDIPLSSEVEDIKRFKREIANYLQLPITYANINGITNPEELPDQFDVCMEAGALTNDAGHAICTSRLKTEPFDDYLNLNFINVDTLFERRKDCIIYYGFDAHEPQRITRRSSLLGIRGYKTAYPLIWKNRTIFSTSEIGIDAPLTYLQFIHANCIGCLKAGLLHWYVVYCIRPDKYQKGILLEEKVNFTIHTIQRNKVKIPISLKDLAPIFEQMKMDGIPITERQSMQKFARMIRKYQLEECNSGKPCECIVS